MFRRDAVINSVMFPPHFIWCVLSQITGIREKRSKQNNRDAVKRNKSTLLKSTIYCLKLLKILLKLRRNSSCLSTQSKNTPNASAKGWVFFSFTFTRKSKQECPALPHTPGTRPFLIYEYVGPNEVWVILVRRDIGLWPSVMTEAFCVSLVKLLPFPSLQLPSPTEIQQVRMLSLVVLEKIIWGWVGAGGLIRSWPRTAAVVSSWPVMRSTKIFDPRGCAAHLHSHVDGCKSWMWSVETASADERPPSHV